MIYVVLGRDCLLAWLCEVVYDISGLSRDLLLACLID
jgi:hypothetical protein